MNTEGLPDPDRRAASEPTSQGFVSPRELRIARIVESFVEQIRDGGSLDIEPYLQASEELRAELEPLLRGILRLEAYAHRFEGRRTRQAGSGGAAGSS